MYLGFGLRVRFIVLLSFQCCPSNGFLDILDFDLLFRDDSDALFSADFDLLLRGDSDALFSADFDLLLRGDSDALFSADFDVLLCAEFS